jgi:hypothetical protein
MLALGFDPAHYFPPTASPWSGKPIIEEVEEDLETAEDAGYASAVSDRQYTIPLRPA